MSNDQLRWNLQQKQSALDAALRTIDSLRRELATTADNSNSSSTSGKGAIV
jgi:hypothetical protein